MAAIEALSFHLLKEVKGECFCCSQLFGFHVTQQTIAVFLDMRIPERRVTITETRLHGDDRDNPVLAELAPSGHKIHYPPCGSCSGGDAIRVWKSLL